MKADTVLKCVQQVSQPALDGRSRNAWFAWGCVGCAGLQDESHAESDDARSPVAGSVHKPRAWAQRQERSSG